MRSFQLLSNSVQKTAFINIYILIYLLFVKLIAAGLVVRLNVDK